MLNSFGANCSSLKDSPLLETMATPKIAAAVDPASGTCRVTGAAFLLQTSLEKIGFAKCDGGAFILYFDNLRTAEFVSHHLTRLCEVKGWDLTLGTN